MARQSGLVVSRRTSDSPDHSVRPNHPDLPNHQHSDHRSAARSPPIERHAAQHHPRPLSRDDTGDLAVDLLLDRLPTAVLHRGHPFGHEIDELLGRMAAASGRLEAQRLEFEGRFIEEIAVMFVFIVPVPFVQRRRGDPVPWGSSP